MTIPHRNRSKFVNDNR